MGMQISIQSLMGYQVGKATIFLLLPFVVLSFHLLMSVVLWKRFAVRPAVKRLIVLSLFSYVFTWGMSLLEIVLFGFSSRPVIIPEAEFASTIFTFILNPCRLFPQLADLVGAFMCNTAILWFGPCFFFLIGLLPGIFVRYTNERESFSPTELH
jgi:hypothetical protein